MVPMADVEEEVEDEDVTTVDVINVISPARDLVPEQHLQVVSTQKMRPEKAHQETNDANVTAVEAAEDMAEKVRLEKVVEDLADVEEDTDTETGDGDITVAEDHHRRHLVAQEAWEDLI